MNKYHVLLILLCLGMVGYAAFRSGHISFHQHTIHTQRTRTFVLDRDFQEVRKSFVKGRFQEEILRVNNAQLLKKTWIDKKLSIQKPLRYDRYWSFDGEMLATIQVAADGQKPITVEMVHDIHVAKDAIAIKATLAKPLEIGVTNLYQELEILPDGPGKTKVIVSVYIKLQRFIPSPWRDYAEKQVATAADSSVSNFEQVIRAMPEVNGIVIPLAERRRGNRN